VRTIRACLTAALIFGVCSTAGAVGNVTGMRLLTANAGWAVSSNQLYWTTDAGIHWKNITPKTNGGSERPGSFSTPAPGQDIAGVFFLNARQGWVLLCCDQAEPGKLAGETQPQYEMALTTDGGASWSVARVKLPRDASIPSEDNNGGQIGFADAEHGWMNLTGCGGHSCWGDLLATSDGGRTWKEVKSSPGSADPFYLVTPSLGWQVSFPSRWFDDSDLADLYVTRDAARSWHKVSIPLPQGMPGRYGKHSVSADFRCLPTFEGDQHGFIAVIYRPGRRKDGSTIVQFETEDAGRTWKPTRSLTNLFVSTDEDSCPAVYAGSTLIAATRSEEKKHDILSMVGPGGRKDIDISSSVEGSFYGIQMDFHTPQQGWMIAGNELQATTDGGASWSNVDPYNAQGGASSVNLQTCSAGSLARSSVRAMQLLTSTTGWVQTEINSLVWTEDGGEHWSTVRLPASNVFSIFFLDSKHGWSLALDSRRLVISSTADSGANWSISSVPIPGLQLPGIPLSGGTSEGQIYFKDLQHGWISLYVEDSQNSTSFSSILITSDGGKTWNALKSNDIGAMGYLRFATATDGWMRVPSTNSLYATHDGGNSWSKISLDPPAEILPANQATYDLPTFQDSKHGFLPVTYSGDLGVSTAVVLFATEDGGASWKADRMMTGLSGMPAGNLVASEVVGSSWLLVGQSSGGTPVLTNISQGAHVKAGSALGSSYYGTRQLSFVSSSRGWTVLDDNRLLSTTTGSDWAEVGPDQSPAMPGNWRYSGSNLSAEPQHQSAFAVSSMHLFGPKVGIMTSGWYGTADRKHLHVFRTQDDGEHWKEITPSFSDKDRIVSDFSFFDSDHGVIVVWHWAPIPPPGWLWRWWKGVKTVKTDYQPLFELLETADAGASWTRQAMDIPKVSALRGTPTPPTAEIGFVDKSHGWMTISLSTTTDAPLHWDHKLLMTNNGGASWREAADAPLVPQAVRFATASDGWVLGESMVPAEKSSTAVPTPNPRVPPEFLQRLGARRIRPRPRVRIVTDPGTRITAGHDLYVTHDGAESWQKVSVATPGDVYSDDVIKNRPPSPSCTAVNVGGVTINDISYPPPTAMYGLPTFTDAKHGYLPVTYSGQSGIDPFGNGSLSCPETHLNAVLFITNDGGYSWNPNRMITSSPGGNGSCSNDCTVQSTVGGAAWVLATYAAASPSFTSVDAGGKATSAGGDQSVFWPMYQDSLVRGFAIEFVSPQMGWVSWRNELLSTTDGGTTLTPIGPELGKNLEVH
jgi:photosystem II stability/assembly factor-like uncharacterized protein